MNEHDLSDHIGWIAVFLTAATAMAVLPRFGVPDLAAVFFGIAAGLIVYVATIWKGPQS